MNCDWCGKKLNMLKKCVQEVLNYLITQLIVLVNVEMNMKNHNHEIKIKRNQGLKKEGALFFFGCFSFH